MPAEIATRVVLVEDLSDQLMEALGSTFMLNPDLFAKHLSRSSHHRFDHDDPVAELPVGPGGGPNFASLRWIRPVRQNPILSEWLSKPETLLAERTIVAKHGKKSVAQRGITWLERLDRNCECLHLFTADTDIFRRCWRLTSASGSSLDRNLPNDPTSQDWSETAVPTVWEERVTVTVVREATGTFGSIEESFFCFDSDGQ